MNTTLDLSELNRKIGQLFMAGMPGPTVDGGTETLIRDYNLGGIVLFSRNVEDPVQLATLCCDLQGMSRRHHGLPLFLSIDQEGGRVARLKEPFTLFPGNTAIGADDHPEERAEEFGRITAREMKLVGLNMNFAPVVDVAQGVPEKHLTGRTFGEDPEIVARLGRRVVRSLQENGIMAVAKHFPGLGRAKTDPHFLLPKIQVGKDEIEKVNLPPFRAAIEERVSAVMTSHAVYPALDPNRPATLSADVVNLLLRGELGFEGLVITDDLEMGAIAKEWSVAEGAFRAFEAGADILLICEDQTHVLEGLKRIRSGLLQGELRFERLHSSSERIRQTRSRFLEPEEEISIEKVKAYF